MQQTASTIANRREPVVTVPSTSELMRALLDHTTANRRTVTFTLRGGEKVEVAIDNVRPESGDGESWFFAGTIPGTATVIVDGRTRAVTPRVEGWFTTHRNIGWLERGIIR